MNPIRFLVLGVGGNVSQGIISALKASKIQSYIVGACISPDSIGLYECDKGYISPYANHADFLPWVISICKKERIQMILTGVEEIIVVLANHQQKLWEECGTKFVSCLPKQLEIGGDKLKTCQWLEENGCQYPLYAEPEDGKAVELLVEKAGFPLIAKPRRGKGSQGIFLLKDAKDFSLIEKLEQYVIQECVGSVEDEYTVGVYYDKNGDHQGTVVMHRYLEHGTTVKAIVVDNKIIQKEAEKIAQAFKPIGPLNVQMRQSGDRAVCFELNVRFSGTTPMRAHFGFNDVEALVGEYLLDEPVSGRLQAQLGGMAFRTLHEVYTNEEQYLNLIKNKQTN